MSANPHANGGRLLRDLVMPDFREYAVPVESPAFGTSEATRVLGTFLRDVIAGNPDRFRLMGPDETVSNRLTPVFEETDRAWDAATLPDNNTLLSVADHCLRSRNYVNLVIAGKQPAH